MKKIFAIIILAVIFIVAVFILNDRYRGTPVVTGTPTLTSEPTDTDQSVSGQVHEITISENGVSQNNLTIQAGDTVKFINNDSALHWPASDTHPTHKLCPGFDALRGLKQGENYSFTFNTAGFCPFHDHLHARDSILSGIIDVSGGK